MELAQVLKQQLTLLAGILLQEQQQQNMMEPLGLREEIWEDLTQLQLMQGWEL